MEGNAAEVLANWQSVLTKVDIESHHTGGGSEASNDGGLKCFGHPIVASGIQMV